jgi:hypothetical protein
MRGSDDKASQNAGLAETLREGWFLGYALICRGICTILKICKLCMYEIYHIDDKVDFCVNLLKKCVFADLSESALSKSEIDLRQCFKSKDAVVYVHLREPNERRTVRNIIMNILGKSKGLCSAVFAHLSYASEVFNEQEATVCPAETLKNGEESANQNLKIELAQLNSCLPSNNFVDEISEQLEEALLQLEIESIMSKVDRSGFTGDDRAILRSDIPIPEKYGSYQPTEGELKKAIPITYVREENNFIVDEERSQARKAWDS